MIGPSTITLATALPDTVPNKARTYHRNLARAAGGVAGNRQGEVHEQPSGAAPFHERAEQHEQHHVGGRHPQRRAEDPLEGEIHLLHQDRQLHVGEEDRVGDEHESGDRQRPAEDAPRRLEDDQHRYHRVDLVEGRHVVDVDGAVGDVFVIEKDVQDEGPRTDEQDHVKDAPTDAAAGLERVQQEHQGKGKQQVGAPEDHRLGRSEPGDVHVVQRHCDGDDRNGPLERLGLGRGCRDLFGYDRDGFRHERLLSETPNFGRKNGAAGAAPRQYCGVTRVTLTYSAPTSL